MAGAGGGMGAGGRPARAPTMGHVPALDGLRALAIVLVYVSHAGLGRVVPGGLGVTLFFFLSGFLITSLLRAEVAGTGGIGFGGFYLRRLLRIVPPLWITMGVVAVLVAAGLVPAPVPPEARGAAAQALFLANYAEIAWGWTGLPAMPLWSLAVEEHFYMVFPAALCLMRGRPPATAAAWCAAACAAVLLVRCWYVLALGETFATYYLTHTRIDSILFGCVLALWQNPVLDRGAWRPGRGWTAAALTLLAATLAVRSPLFRETIRYSLQGVALFVLFSSALHAKGAAARWLTHPVLRRIGLYSYTVYLIHVAVIHLVAERLTGGSLLAAGLVAILPCWAYAAAMHRWVEKPLAAVRRRLDPARPATAAVPAPTSATG